MEVLDFIFPKTCVGCGREGAFICQGCLKSLSRTGLVCPECEKPSFGGMTHPGCRHPYGMDGLFAVWKYQGTIKRAIGQLKFKFTKEIVNYLADEAVMEVDRDEKSLAFKKETRESVWVGVPLHYLRERWRGFNQADVLAGELAKKISGRFSADVVRREEYTRPQVGLGEKERKENITGSFRVSKGVDDKRIILVDDVWTTGATIKELTKILKRRGARSVWGLVLAR